ncbi:MAG: 50S ribosomal protein L23 [Candidatus Saganbacteria bacterium]|nr:50S ribosomal protein L23 [Candidatus Saganbacteria bacterium]
MNNNDAVILSPIVTEKGFSVAAQNKYVFRVHPKANKIEIRKAVEELYQVKVVSINTLKVRGKERRTGHTKGRTSSHKKAYVTLKEGSQIEELKA